MGGGGSKISDIFYPDNPKRRARASQLSDDVNFFCNQFEQVKKKRNDLLEELNPRLGQLLKKYGYNSPEELDAAVRKVLKGDALAEYNQVREQVDKSDQFVTAMFQITGLVGAVSGVFIGSLVVLGVMTGGVALGVIGIIGAVLGVIALIGFLFSVFDGAEERANMRKAIHDLSFERVKARAAYEAMNALSNWVYNIKLWLDEPLIAEDEAIMRKKLEGDFANDYNKSKRSAVVSYLKSYDSSRGSWTNEDPNWWTGPEDILSASYSLPATKTSSRRYFADRSAYLGDVQELRDLDDLAPDQIPKVKLSYTSPDGTGTLDLLFLTSDNTSCRGLDSNSNTWILRYLSGSDTSTKEPDLANYLFTLINIDTGVREENKNMNPLWDIWHGWMY